MTRLHSKSGYGHVVLRKWLLKLIDTLKRGRHESRPDVIIKAVKHYLSCPLVNAPQTLAIGFRPKVAVAFESATAVEFPVEVNFNGRRRR